MPRNALMMYDHSMSKVIETFLADYYRLNSNRSEYIAALSQTATSTQSLTPWNMK